VGATASLSLTLLNNGAMAITNISLAVGGDYAVTVPCAVTTLAAGGSCSVTVSFTPTLGGARAGTLTVSSSDVSSPATVALTGTGAAGGSFTLSVGGGQSASATVASGGPAAYNLAVTPVNGFSGAVVLNCTAVVAAQDAYCSLTPSSVTLGAAQSAVATLTTVTSAAGAVPGGRGRSFGDTALCLFFPAMIFCWKARRSRHPAWRTVGPVAWAITATIALLSAGGCGGSSGPAASNLLYAPAGSYQYQVTASAVSGAAIKQTVTLNLIVQ
jgi:hypothetical protein